MLQTTRDEAARAGKTLIGATRRTLTGRDREHEDGGAAAPASAPAPAPAHLFPLCTVGGPREHLPPESRKRARRESREECADGRPALQMLFARKMGVDVAQFGASYLGLGVARLMPSHAHAGDRRTECRW